MRACFAPTTRWCLSTLPKRGRRLHLTLCGLSQQRRASAPFLLHWAPLAQGCRPTPQLEVRVVWERSTYVRSLRSEILSCPPARCRSRWLCSGLCSPPAPTGLTSSQKCAAAAHAQQSAKLSTPPAHPPACPSAHCVGMLECSSARFLVSLPYVPCADDRDRCPRHPIYSEQQHARRRIQRAKVPATHLSPPICASHAALSLSTWPPVKRAGFSSSLADCDVCCAFAQVLGLDKQSHNSMSLSFKPSTPIGLIRKTLARLSALFWKPLSLHAFPSQD